MHMKKMENKSVFAAVLFYAAAMGSHAEVKVERSPLEIGTALDIGQIINGASSPTTHDPSDGQMIQRTAVYLNQLTTVNDRLLIKVGVGGLFFYSYPESQNDPASRAVRFGPGVGQAQGIYKVGDLDNPSCIFQFGYFPYKYNPDAKNLGEYLIRSGTYPGYEVTGGWSIINSALYMASGLRINGKFLSGKLSADLNVFMERDLEPNHDLSPSIVLAYKPTPLFEVGAGAEFSHLVPIIPSQTKSKGTFYLNDTLADPTTPGAKHLTFQGIKLMARASANFGSLLNHPMIGEEGLKLYTEAAILGVQNYPYYYDNIWQRIPVLLGLNLPTLGFFDVLAVEGEYRKWPFPNNTTQIVDNNLEPIYDLPQPDPNNPLDVKTYNPRHHPDSVFSSDENLKWTIYVKKRLMPGIAIYAQAASDYFRGIRWEDNALDREPITREYRQWYYLFRLEFGI